MQYASGPKPDCFDQSFDVRALGWPVYTLEEGQLAVQETISAGRHLGIVTSVSVMHSLIPTRRQAVLYESAPQRWYSVITRLRDTPSSVASLEEAMQRHVRVNTSNFERWEGPLEAPSFEIEVDSMPVASISARAPGLSVFGFELGDQWVSVVVPDVLGVAATLRLTAI